MTKQLVRFLPIASIVNNGAGNLKNFMKVIKSCKEMDIN